MPINIIFLVSFFIEFINSSAFVISTTSRPTRSSALSLQKRPVVVVGTVESVGSEPALRVDGSAPAALVGAALALSARDLLNGVIKLPIDETPPPAQPITMLTALHKNAPPSLEDSLYEYLEETLWDSPALLVRRTENNDYPLIPDYECCLVQQHDNPEWNNKPILHVVMEGGTAAEALLDRQIRNNVFYLGIEPVVPLEKNGVVAPDLARQCGSIVQEILDFYQANQEAAAISLDLPLHLSMLQANCLPQSPTHSDSFAVLPSSDRGLFSTTSFVVNYLYDYENKFGGTDPLACPTKEFVIPVPPPIVNNNAPLTMLKAASHAAAAAYTVLRGHGMESVLSMCIAASIESLFREEQQYSSFECPPYTWSSIARVASLSERVRDNVVEEQVIRQKYIEFGYK